MEPEEAGESDLLVVRSSDVSPQIVSSASSSDPSTAGLSAGSASESGSVNPWCLLVLLCVLALLPFLWPWDVVRDPPDSAMCHDLDALKPAGNDPHRTTEEEKARSDPSSSPPSSPALPASSSSLLRPHMLLVNGHDGVMLDGMFVAELMNFRLSFRRPLDYEVSAALAERHWYHDGFQADCTVYDYIVLGDTIAKGRAYLQYVDECVGSGARVVLLVTNRYDFKNELDDSYHEVFRHASKHPGVRIVQNNLFEEWHARERLPDVRFHAYIPSPGLGGSQLTVFYDTFRRCSQGTRDLNNPWHASHMSAPLEAHLFMHKAGQVERQWLVGMQPRFGPLSEHHIYHLNHMHGGPLTVANRVLLHVPYQSNTMSLFENLQHNITYLLPAMPLYRQWYYKGTRPVFARGMRRWDDAVAAATWDWWRPELAHLFYYFHSLDELRLGSPLRQRIEREAHQHRQKVFDYMQHTHAPQVRRGWQQVFASFDAAP